MENIIPYVLIKIYSTLLVLVTTSAQVLTVPVDGIDEGKDAVMTCKYEEGVTTDDIDMVDWRHRDNSLSETQLFIHFTRDKNGNPFNDWIDREVVGTFVSLSHSVRLPSVIHSDSKEYVCTYRLHNGGSIDASNTLYINGLLLLLIKCL